VPFRWQKNLEGRETHKLYGFVNKTVVPSAGHSPGAIVLYSQMARASFRMGGSKEIYFTTVPWRKHSGARATSAGQRGARLHQTDEERDQTDVQKYKYAFDLLLLGLHLEADWMAGKLSLRITSELNN
jgi:hypothetical protein